MTTTQRYLRRARIAAAGNDRALALRCILLALLS